MFFSRVAQSPPVTSPEQYEGRIEFPTQDCLRLIVSEALEERASWNTLVLETGNLVLMLLVWVQSVERSRQEVNLPMAVKATVQARG